MKCPTCRVKLQRVQYEGLNIYRCGQCRGNLLRRSRLKSIQTRRNHSDEDLLEEVVNEATDSLHLLRCPECLSKMEKRRRKFGSAEFFIDQCQKCDLLWLDAGELAKMQVIYEYSDQGEEAERFKQRLAQMSSEEKAALKERIARLPEDNFPKETLTSGLILELLTRKWSS